MHDLYGIYGDIMSVPRFTSLEPYLVSLSSEEEARELEWFKSLDPYYRSRSNTRAREEARHSLIKWLLSLRDAFPDLREVEHLIARVSEDGSLAREDISYIFFFLRSKNREDLMPSDDEYERWLLWELIY